jgi:hypothetical protein
MPKIKIVLNQAAFAEWLDTLSDFVRLGTTGIDRSKAHPQMKKCILAAVRKFRKKKRVVMKGDSR